MSDPDSNTKINQTSQLSENGGGVRSFSDPVDFAKGGGSKLDHPEFGSRAASEERSAQQSELRRQVHMNRKKERAARIGYRAAMKRGDGAGALKLLNLAEEQGINPFGIRQHGARERQADAQLRGKRSTEVAAGTRTLDPKRDYFQRLFNSNEQGDPQDVESTKGGEVSDFTGPEVTQLESDFTDPIPGLQFDKIGDLDDPATESLSEVAVPGPDGQYSFKKRLAEFSDFYSDGGSRPKGALGFAADLFGLKEGQAKRVLDRLDNNRRAISRGATFLSRFL